MNDVFPVALPPAVFTATFPLFAPLGTLAVICVPELTVKVVAFTPPKVTWVAPFNPDSAVVTTVPAGCPRLMRVPIFHTYFFSAEGKLVTTVRESLTCCETR